MKNINFNKLNPDYVSGLIQSDGSFHVTVQRKGNNLWLSPKLNLTLHKKNEELIKLIKDFFNTGYYRIDNKGYCRYNVSNINDINNIIIPFFLKYQLRSNKFISFIKFKILCEKLLNKEHYKKQNEINHNINLLYLINLAYNINPLNKHKINNKELLRYLNDNDKNIIINNDNIHYQDLIDEQVKLYKLNNSINIDFIKGLFDGDGNVTVYLSDLRIRMYFNIIQDINNKSLLDEIKLFFNNKGNIYNIKDNNAFRYDVKSINDIDKYILPKFNNLSNGSNYNIKLYKLDYIKKIIELINNNKTRKIINKQQLIELSKLTYYIFNNINNINLDKYILEILNKYENKLK